MIEGLDLRTAGVLLKLLCIADEEGICQIQVRKFARENGLSHREIRTIISILQKTHWVTHLATHSGTLGATHLTLNISAVCDILKNIKRHIPRHIKRHIEGHIEKPIEQVGEKELITVKTEKKEAIDWESFMAFFNNKVQGTKIPQVRVLTEGRKKQIRALLGKYSKQDLVRAIEICTDTPFLRGDNNRGWTVNIDWIYTEKHFIKIMEGNYDWKGNNGEAGNVAGRSQGRGATLEGVAREILRSCQSREA